VQSLTVRRRHALQGCHRSKPSVAAGVGLRRIVSRRARSSGSALARSGSAITGVAPTDTCEPAGPCPAAPRRRRQMGNPGHQVKTMCGGRCQHYGPVFGDKLIENLLVALSCADHYPKFGHLRLAGRAAQVVALAQQLRATALAHQPVTQVGDPRTLSVAPIEKQTATASAAACAALSKGDSFHAMPPLNAGSLGLVRAGTRTAPGRAQSRNQRHKRAEDHHHSPAQIQPTSG